MKRSSVVSAFFVLVLLILLGTGLYGPRDPLADAAGMQQVEVSYPQETHVTLYHEHLARMDTGPEDCR